jgi:DNA adenine methylase
MFDPIGKGFNEALCLIADKNIPKCCDTPHPFVKWVGGKRSIVRDLLARVPDDFKSYFEPFAGGAPYFGIYRAKAKLIYRI